MTPSRWQEIERLSHQALERSPADRAAFLQVACGSDDDLRREVESLLRHDAAAERFLDPPVYFAPEPDPPRDLEAHSAGPDGSRAGDALCAGAKLGFFEVIGIIGAGGMGEVYRARDTRLHRDVALKVLPGRFARDSERLARFEREAQVLASLNHPHIATIHGVERVGPVFALVLEIIDGTTIAERLRRGALPVHESLQIAQQIAVALEAAHERGVVHRDLKPANVIVMPDGHVKLLDFGVAKALDQLQVGATHRATEAPLNAGTRPGTVPGTAAYMSPEQARGEAIDRRSDIWAFGCLLFEMLVGRSPFLANTVEQTLANVCEGPVDFAALPATTPASTRRLIRLCLERSPRSRLQHIGDARVDLTETLIHDNAERFSLSRAPAPTRSLPRSIGVGALLLVLLASVVGWFAGSRSSSRAAAVVRFTVIPHGVAPLTPTARTMAISPDGSRIAYVTGGWLWLRQLNAMDAVRVPDTDNSGGEPFFSPDGEWVGFFEVNTGLKKVRVRGGPVSSIVVNAGRQLGASWGADGTIVFADGVGLFAVGADDGRAREIARPGLSQGETRYAWPQLLPNGRAVLFTVLRDRIENAEIAALDLNTKRQRVLVRGGHAARYVSTGHLVYAAMGQLHAVPFDPTSLGVFGEPIGLGSVKLSETIGSVTANFDVSLTGTLVYVAALQQRLRTLVWVDRTGREEPTRAAPGNYLYPRISPDGTRVALDVAGANRDIWAWNLERDVMTRITDGPTEDMMPAWSADGRRIFFASDPDGVFGVYVRSGDGSGPATRVYRGSDNSLPFFSPDSASLLIFTQGPTAPSGDISLLRLAAPAEIQPLIRTKHREGSSQVSPDGRWVAYHSDESGRQEVYVRSFPDVDRKMEMVSRDGGMQARWSPAGNELFYRALDGTMRSVSVRLSPDLVVGPTTALFSARGYAGNPLGSWAYDVSPRDSRFLMLKEQASTDAVPISVVVNWFEELTFATRGQ